MGARVAPSTGKSLWSLPLSLVNSLCGVYTSLRVCIFVLLPVKRTSFILRFITSPLARELANSKARPASGSAGLANPGVLR